MRREKATGIGSRKQGQSPLLIACALRHTIRQRRGDRRIHQRTCVPIYQQAADMNDEHSSSVGSSDSAARWQALPAIDRRVAGVLVEKAKTVPDAYPMSLNAIRTATNQKSNRYPVMELEVEDIEESLERLRELGAAAEIQGGGRVSRYRHYMYEWLGVDKVELAVMAELLLRGPQTVGELRGRAARMEPIADVAALRPILQSLISKNLVLSLTPEGRGQIVTHNLYKPRELEKIRAEHSGGGQSHMAESEPRREATPVMQAASNPPASISGDTEMADRLNRLEQELAQVRQEVTELRQRFDMLGNMPRP